MLQSPSVSSPNLSQTISVRTLLQIPWLWAAPLPEVKLP